MLILCLLFLIFRVKIEEWHLWAIKRLRVRMSLNKVKQALAVCFFFSENSLKIHRRQITFGYGTKHSERNEKRKTFRLTDGAHIAFCEALWNRWENPFQHIVLDLMNTSFIFQHETYLILFRWHVVVYIYISLFFFCNTQYNVIISAPYFYGCYIEMGGKGLQ